jgi:hypothetical protein
MTLPRRRLLTEPRRRLPGPQPIIIAEWRYATPLDNVPPELAQRLASKTVIRENGCHEWIGRSNYCWLWRY